MSTRVKAAVVSGVLTASLIWVPLAEEGAKIRL
jgi:hypothetical protein